MKYLNNIHESVDKISDYELVEDFFLDIIEEYDVEMYPATDGDYCILVADFECKITKGESVREFKELIKFENEKNKLLGRIGYALNRIESLNYTWSFEIDHKKDLTIFIYYPSKLPRSLSDILDPVNKGKPIQNTLLRKFMKKNYNARLLGISSVGSSSFTISLRSDDIDLDFWKKLRADLMKWDSENTGLHKRIRSIEIKTNARIMFITFNKNMGLITPFNQ